VGSPKYAYWSDNLVPDATPAWVSPAVEDSDYPLSKLHDGDPAWPCRTAQTSARLVLDFGTAVLQALVAVIHHNFDAALACSWQAHTADSWGAPDYSGAFTVGAASADNYRPDLWQAPGVTKRYGSLNVSGTNSATLALGQLFVGSALRSFFRGLTVGHDEGADVGVSENITDGGTSFRIKKGFRLDMLQGTFVGSRAETEEIIELFLALAGSAEPLLLIPDDTVAYCALTLLDRRSIRRQTLDGDVYQVQVNFRQLSRGLTY